MRAERGIGSAPSFPAIYVLLNFPSLAACFGLLPFVWPFVLSSFVLSYLFVFISRCSLRLRLCSLLTLEVAAKSGALHALTDENKMKGTFEVHILVVGSLRA